MTMTTARPIRSGFSTSKSELHSLIDSVRPSDTSSDLSESLLLAVSSLRALAMLTPFGADLGTAPLPLLVTLIAVFACGILVSMSLFGVALARLLSMRALERIGHGAGALVGVSSVVLGVAWVLTA